MPPPAVGGQVQLLLDLGDEDVDGDEALHRGHLHPVRDLGGAGGARGGLLRRHHLGGCLGGLCRWVVHEKDARLQHRLLLSLLMWVT